MYEYDLDSENLKIIAFVLQDYVMTSKSCQKKINSYGAEICSIILYLPKTTSPLNDGFIDILKALGMLKMAQGFRLINM